MVALTLLLTLVVAMTPLAIDMYLPAMPAIATDLNVSLATIQRSLSTFLIGFACGQLLHGPLSDAIGRRPVILTGLALFVVASGAAALASDASHFLHWRIVQAFGGAAGAVVTNAIITDNFEGAKAIKVRSTMMTVMLLAPLLAPTLGAHLLALGGWRSIYWVLASYGLVVLIWIRFALPVTHSGVGSKSPQALLGRYKQVLSEPKGWLWFPGMAFSSAPLFCFLAGSPYVYIEYYQVSPELYGYLFATNAAVMAVGAVINVRLAGRVSPAKVMRRVQRIQCSALLLMLLLELTGLMSLPLLILLIACSVGLNSLVFPNGNQIVMEMFRTNAGTAAALLGASQFGIGALASSLVALGTGHGPLGLILTMAVTGTLSFILLGVGVRRYQFHKE